MKTREDKTPASGNDETTSARVRNDDDDESRARQSGEAKGRTVDVTGIVTKEDTSKRGKGAHQVGLEGDRRLDDGGGPVHGRHDERGLLW